MIEKGKIYLCLVCPYDNFTEGKEYVAIENNVIYDDYGVKVWICDGACKFTEVKPDQSPAKLIQSAKQVCNEKINDAIIEFEESTGLDVSDIEYHKTDTPICFSDNVRSKETMTQKWVTIVISL